jgi:predicted oxidoreductase
MLKRPLGRSPLQISVLAYGAWRLAGSEGHPAIDGSSHGIRALNTAVDAGINFIDLADIYGGGRCEEIVGEALRQSPGLRQRLVIATKCGIRRAGDTSPHAPFRYDFSREHILRSVEVSLKRMGLHEIDLLMLHRPDYLMDPAEVTGAFSDLRQAGKVREFGVSNFTPSQVTALQRAFPHPLVVNQVEISLMQTATLDDGTLHQCLELGITPMAWSPLGRGALVQDPGTLTDARQRRVAESLARVAGRLGTTPSVLALAWLLRHPSGIVPILGTCNPGRIVEQAGAAALELSREDWYELLEASRGSRLP